MANGNNIKGITINIDGETKGLNNALKDVTKRTRDVSAELKDVDRLLKFNPGNMEVIAQKQALLTQQVENTKDALNTLKGAEAEVQAQFKRGDIAEAQYRGFRREVLRAESQLANFETQLQSVSQSANMDPVTDDIKSVAEQSVQLVKDLKQIEQALKLDPGNSELVEQQLRNLNRQAVLAAQSVEELRAQQRETSAEEIGDEAYDRLRISVIRAEQQVASLDQAIRDVGNSDNLEEVEEAVLSISEQSDLLVKDLKQIDNALKLDPGNTELVEQRMRTLNRQAVLAAKSLQELQTQQQQTSAVDVGEEEYERLRRSVIQAELEVKNLNDEIRSLGQKTKLDELRQDLSSVTGDLTGITKELKTVEAMLKLDPGNLDLIAQKQQLLQQQIQGTTTTLNKLQAAQSAVTQQFNEGKIKGDAYREFQRDILRTEQQLGSFQTQLQEMNQPVDLSAMRIELERLDKKSRESVESLRRIDEALKLDPRSTELLEQRMRALTQQASLAENQLQELKNKQQQMTAALGNGSLGQDEYDQFRLSVLRAEQQVQSLNDQVRQAGNVNMNRVVQSLNEIREEADKASNAVGSLGGALGGLTAGVGMGGAISKALETDSLKTSVAINFDVPEESKAKVEAAIRDVTTYGVDAQEAVEGVRRQFALNSDATDDVNIKTAELGATMARTFHQLDFTELIQETHEIGKEIGMTNQEAMAFSNTLMDSGFPPEQIDTVAEYGQQLKRAGFNAQEIQTIMIKASQSGTWNVDNLLDGLKEGRIRAVEMSQGLSETFKTSIRGLTNTVKPATKEVLDEMKEAASEREALLQEANAREEDLLQSGLDDQLETVTESVEKQTETYKKNLDKQLKNTEANLDRQKKALDKSHEDELKNAEKLADEKIKLIDKEYTERLKLVDEERYNALKKIDDQIKGVEAVMSAEDKRAEEADNNAKRNELLNNVANARSSVAKAKAQEELAKFDEDLRRKKLKEDRQANLESLRQEKDTVKSAFDERMDKIKEEQEAAKERATVTIEAEREAIATRQEMEKESFDARRNASLESVREQNATDLSEYQKLNQQKLENLRETNQSRLDAVKEANQAELDAQKELNATNIKKAEKPADSQITQDTIKQLEDWGKAIGAGGSAGATAYADMVQWVDKIQDGPLRDLIGTQIFGTKWEDQGENIVESLSGIDEAIIPVNESMSDLKENTDTISGETVNELRSAMADLLVALEPVLELIADIIGQLATWISENPELASTITLVVGAIAIISGALFALAPIIGFVIGAARILVPALAAISGPVWIVIGVIVALIAIGVALWKNWDTISAKATEIFSYVGEFIGTSLDWIGEKFTAIMGWIVEKTVGAFTFVGDTVGGAKDRVLGFIGELMERMSAILSIGLQIVKDFFTQKFDEIYGSVSGKMEDVFTSIHDSITNVIDFLTSIDLFELGGNIIQGLIDGILSMKDFLLDAVDTMVGDSLIGKAFDLLDVNSPSRVFRDLGKYSGEGLVNGLHSMGDRVAKASEKMTGKTIASPGGVELAGVNMGGVGGNNAPAPQQPPQIVIQNMTVRNDDDIERISRELHRLSLQQQKGR